ncbi:MAG: hypothetical protein P8Y27_21330 [Chromatiaceae bacterium]
MIVARKAQQPNPELGFLGAAVDPLASTCGRRSAGEVRTARALPRVWTTSNRISLAPWEKAGVRETVMAAATYILRGGAAAMANSYVRRPGRQTNAPFF